MNWLVKAFVRLSMNQGNLYCCCLFQLAYGLRPLKLLALLQLLVVVVDFINKNYTGSLLSEQKFFFVC
jgi:hypothetical protein